MDENECFLLRKKVLTGARDAHMFANMTVVTSHLKPFTKYRFKVNHVGI